MVSKLHFADQLEVLDVSVSELKEKQPPCYARWEAACEHHCQFVEPIMLYLSR